MPIDTFLWSFERRGRKVRRLRLGSWESCLPYFLRERRWEDAMSAVEMGCWHSQLVERRCRRRKMKRCWCFRKSGRRLTGSCGVISVTTWYYVCGEVELDAWQRQRCWIIAPNRKYARYARYTRETRHKYTVGSCKGEPVPHVRRYLISLSLTVRAL
jgi:hypothetical protein